MERSRDDEWIQELLKQSEAEIEDAGFTRRVVEALPARPATGRLRSLILLGATCLACLLALFVLPAGDFITEALQEAFAPGASLTTYIACLAIGALAVGGAWCVATSEA
jgi:hypothetical protein